MDEITNLDRQLDEVEALASIYGDDWHVDEHSSRSFWVAIAKNVRLIVRFTDDYPTDGPPHFELDAVELTGQQKNEIAASLNDLYSDNIGESVIYIWVEAVREYLLNIGALNSPSSPTNHEHIESKSSTEVDDKEKEPKLAIPEIFHDEPIVDRKSTFQAHVARVNDTSEVHAVMMYLLRNKKIAAATHNIQAYRIQLASGAVAEDCNDDGEAHAGSRVLHLLNILNVINVVVVVSRWYGGIQLGPDRFKHINNCARNALDRYQFIKSDSDKSSNEKKKSTGRLHHR